MKIIRPELVEKIVQTFTERRGFDNAWDSVESSIQDEIRMALSKVLETTVPKRADSEKNSLFWSYNLPLQVMPADPEISGSVEKILNYMPRRESTHTLELNEDTLDGQTREEFFEDAAVHLENLARLMRLAKKDFKVTVYYPDDGMGEERQ